MYSLVPKRGITEVIHQTRLIDIDTTVVAVSTEIGRHTLYLPPAREVISNTLRRDETVFFVAVLAQQGAFYVTPQLQFLTAIVGDESRLVNIVALGLETIAHGKSPLPTHVDGGLRTVFPRIGAAGLPISVPGEIGIVGIEVKGKPSGSLIVYAAIYAALIGDAGIFAE